MKPGLKTFIIILIMLLTLIVSVYGFLHSNFFLISSSVTILFLTVIILLMTERISSRNGSMQQAHDNLKKSNEELEKKAHERALQIYKSEMRFRLLTENSNDGLSLLDESSNIIYRSPGSLRILGEMSRSNTVALAHPEDRELVKNKFAEALSNPGKPVYYLARFPFESGEKYVWVEVSLTNFLSLEGVEAIVANFRNVTERILAEEKLRQSLSEKQMLAERMTSILNTLPAAIALLGSDGLIVEVNAEWEKFIEEKTSEAENYFIGDAYLKIAGSYLLSSKKDEAEINDGILNVLKGEESGFIYEYAHEIKNNKKWFRLIATALKEKEYAGAVVMHLDISELKKMEEERLKNEMLEQRKMAQIIFLAQEKERNAIGTELHDNVNQLLAGTNIFLSLAKKNSAKANEYIESSIKNILTATDENRKIAHELSTPDFKSLELAEMLTNLTDDMLKKAGINVQIANNNFEEDRLTEEQKLATYRIAQEQCTNIIRYANASSVEIKLATEDNHFIMTISDDGNGMCNENKSTGIGLRNIRSRLSVFNGDTNVITSQGKGFILEINIPL